MAYKSAFTGTSIDQAVDEVLNGRLVSVINMTDETSSGTKIYNNTDGAVNISKAFSLDASSTYVLRGTIIGNFNDNPILFTESTNIINSYVGVSVGLPQDDGSSNVQLAGFSDGSRLVAGTATSADISSITLPRSDNANTALDTYTISGIINTHTSTASLQFIINVAAGNTMLLGQCYFELEKVDSNDLFNVQEPT